MSSKTLLIAAAAVGVGGYLFLRSRNAAAYPLTTARPMNDGTDTLAALRSVFGSKAVSQAGSSGLASTLSQALSGANAKASGLLGSEISKMGEGGSDEKAIAAQVGGAVASSMFSKLFGVATSGSTLRAVGHGAGTVGGAAVSAVKKLKFW